MSTKLKKASRSEEHMTETQKHIAELRSKLNAPDPDEIHPFTKYKLFTYLMVLILPLVPFAVYRIWSVNSDFTPKEQKIWTGVIVVIAVYMVSFALH